MSSTKVTNDLLACSCCKTEKPNLLTCSGCHCAQYCGQDCQRKAWVQHKRLCVQIKKQIVVVDSARQVMFDHFKEEEEEFDSYVGDMYGWAEVRPYLRARLKIGRLYIRMAEYEDDPRGFLLGKDAYDELLRLTKEDNQYVRCVYAFVLLELGELQAAFDFVKYWEAVDAARYKVEKVEPLPKTKELWRYPHAEGIFEDVLKYEPGENDGCWKMLDNWGLLVAVLIKFMLFEMLKAGRPDSCLVQKVLAEGKSPADAAKVQKRLLEK